MGERRILPDKKINVTFAFKFQKLLNL